MKQKWKDWFTDECDTCSEDLTKEGMVYIINRKLGICADCYESVCVFLVDVEINEIHERGCDCKDCLDNFVSHIEPEDME